MRTFLLLFLALSGLRAAPLRDDVVALLRGADWRKPARLSLGGLVEPSRAGTEPSQRSFKDLPTDTVHRGGAPALVDVPAERTAEGWVRTEPEVKVLSVPVEERRQGTEPSRRFLMDLNTGLLKEHISEMERRAAPVYSPPPQYEFRQGTQNSRATLVDIRTGQVIEPVGEMERNFVLLPKDVLKERSEPEVEVLSVPVEERRQGTEPSRRFLMDLNTGLLKEHISEMERRAAPVYSPPPQYEFRQGTQNSRATLVDIRTGQVIEPVGEMERNFVLLPKDAPKERSEPEVEVLSVPVEERRQGTEPSRRFLMDLNTGLLKEHISEMERRAAPVYSPPPQYEFRQGTQNSRATLVDIRTGQVIEPVGEMERNFVLLPKDVLKERSEPEVEVLSVPVEERRQGTEPSRRFLMDLNTGLLKEHISEMERRAAPVYSPPPQYEFRQGTQNSRATLVDIRTGQVIEPVGEMERNFALLPKGASRVAEPRRKAIKCAGGLINGRCYHFNPTPLTFASAKTFCKALAPHGDLASVTDGDIHSRLVSLVTKGGKDPVLTWLGGVVKDQQAHWTDGSEWSYSDWMPGHPANSDQSACLEMFRIDESWWTAVSCDLKRASICSYPISA